MEKPVSRPGIWRPVLIVSLLATVSFLIYYGSRLVGSPAIHQVLAAAFGTVYFVAVFFGALYVYTDCYLRGVALGRRIVAASLVPFLWITKDVLLMMGSHPVVESLYWYLNPVSVWIVCLLAVEMGLGTLTGRYILKRRGRAIRVVTLGPLVAIVVGAALFGGILAWGQGENLYVLYLDGYRLLFGSGI
jgi:hypothetical protein